MMGGMMMRRADFSNIQQKGAEMSSTKKVSFNWAELIAWDTYPEDVVFRNDRKKEIVIDDE